MNKHKRAAFLIFVVFILVLTAIIFLFSKEDFTPYIQKNENISVSIHGDVFVPDDVISELNSVVSKYQEGLVLTKAEYIFKNNSDTEAIFQFTGREADSLMGWNIKVYINCQNKNAYLLEYEYGHSKKLDVNKVIEEYNSPIIQKDKNANEMFENYIIENYSDGMAPDKVVVIYNLSEVTVSGYTY